MAATKVYRLRELDFLRGLAILLVLLNHQQLFECTSMMGWIGVDLFFVLSGFLVSGLLFKEYIKSGTIDPWRFLIRRGFKIYPIYYLFYGIYLIPILLKHQFNLTGFLSEMFFVQNYVWGWGYAYRPSWSLAVEEHFYFCFSLLLFWGIRKQFIRLQKQVSDYKITKFEWIVIGCMIGCTVLRVISNQFYPEQNARNITMTHLRLDSLLAGVLVGYWYYFKKEWFEHFILTYKKPLLLLAVALVSFTPFIDHEHSFFAKTFGFLFLYIAFAILLSWFLMEEKINTLLDRYLSKIVVDSVSKIGFASYSIYIIHSFVNMAFAILVVYILKVDVPQPVTFVLTSLISILTGMLMTRYIEKYFLAIRDNHFPARNSAV